MKMITFNAPDNERRRLDNYAKSQSRTRTEILREFMRSLPEVEPKKEPEAQRTPAC